LWGRKRGVRRYGDDRTWDVTRRINIRAAIPKNGELGTIHP